ncbi:uncharacterized protein LOC143465764 [Clavelina lepadiformis]|uniref:uncharacterized protein LOC143465764 n=1 Tax=Clavelina lepadiformis TaxID=159417 RepID=UPI0040424282
MAWKTGLCGCFGNMGLSVIACCAAPLAIGKNAEAVGEPNSVLWVIAVSASPCIAGALLRGLIRKKKGIEGSFWVDCGLWCCVPCCAICQETAETGALDYLQQPEMQAMQREVTNSS